MVLTQRHIRIFREQYRMPISEEVEAILLARLGMEPDPYTYSEQDLYEQARNIILEHQEERQDTDTMND
jgi:hypothetical protein